MQRGSSLTRKSFSTKTKTLELSWKALILSHTHIQSISTFFCLCLQRLCRIWPYPSGQATHSCSALSTSPVILFWLLPSCLHPAVRPVLPECRPDHPSSAHSRPGVFLVIQNITQTTMARWTAVTTAGYVSSLSFSILLRALSPATSWACSFSGPLPAWNAFSLILSLC